jgi:HSP20 family protein
MRRIQDFLPMRRGRETDMSPWSSGGSESPTSLFSLSPWQMMRRMQEDMDQVFGQFFGGAGSALAPAGQQPGTLVWTPTVDISENDKEWTIEAELPGVREEDVEVRVQNHHLVLRAEMRQEEEQPQNGQAQGGQAQGGQAQGGQAQGEQAQARQYLYRERRYGYFQRVFPLPENVDEEQIRCEFRNGVLTVHIPKTEQAREQSRRIPIGAEAETGRRRGDGRTESREPAMAGFRGGEAGSPEQGAAGTSSGEAGTSGQTTAGGKAGEAGGSERSTRR